MSLLQLLLLLLLVAHVGVAAGAERGASARLGAGGRSLRNVTKLNEFFNKHDHRVVATYSQATLPNFFSTLTAANAAAQRRTYHNSNVVFVHQNKAAGSTVKAMLQARCEAFSNTTTCVGRRGVLLGVLKLRGRLQLKRRARPPACLPVCACRPSCLLPGTRR
jgi:hypothetical protein